jgi:hypothetical protein
MVFMFFWFYRFSEKFLHRMPFALRPMLVTQANCGIGNAHDGISVVISSDGDRAVVGRKSELGLHRSGQHRATQQPDLNRVSSGFHSFENIDAALCRGVATPVLQVLFQSSPHGPVGGQLE